MTPFDDVQGQTGAVGTLTRALEAGRLASAYLFEGPGGIGKERAAMALAAARIGAGQPDVARRVLEHNHPDVRIVRPREEGARNIPVETLRNDVLPFTQFAPFEASAAFLIFPEADVSFPDTYPEAANALLKTLEEPRPGVHFVLLSERPDRLLPTIRSRCQRLRFGRLPPPVLRSILASHGVDPARVEEAIALADGRADRALALAQAEGTESLLEVALRIDTAVTAGRPGTLVDEAEALARSDRLPLVLETLATFYRDVACAALGMDDQAFRFPHAAEEIRRRAAQVSARRAATRVARIQEAAALLERQANAQITMDALMYRL